MDDPDPFSQACDGSWFTVCIVGAVVPDIMSCIFRLIGNDGEHLSRDRKSRGDTGRRVAPPVPRQRLLSGARLPVLSSSHHGGGMITTGQPTDSCWRAGSLSHLLAGRPRRRRSPCVLGRDRRWHQLYALPLRLGLSRPRRPAASMPTMPSAARVFAIRATYAGYPSAAIVLSPVRRSRRQPT